MMTDKWVKTVAGNLLLTGDGFWISFSDDSAAHRAARDPLVNSVKNLYELFGSLMGIETGDCETALVIGHEDRKYYILQGDWRAEYEKVFPQGAAACLAFYESVPKEARSRWGTDED